MPKKILVIDDELDFLMMVETRLKAVNYDVITAEDGLEGLEKARAQIPDLIILDVLMPNVDGYHVCRLLKFDRKTKGIPIILLTAKGQKEDKEVGKNVKADAYIVKPFDAQELLLTINKLLSR